jgi:hypothetical protein
MTVQEIRNKFNQLNAFSKKHLNANALRSEWKRVFGAPISKESSEYLTNYYIEMNRRNNRTRRGATRRRRATRRNVTTRHRTARNRRYGGSLSGAPLTYSMTPGANVAVYGRFPTEIGTDASSIKSLDVFYNSALSRGCGTENSGRNVPATLGSNKVGGRRRGAAAVTRRGAAAVTRRGTAALTRRGAAAVTRRGTNGGSRVRSRRSIGGGPLAWIEDQVGSLAGGIDTARPYLASAPPNMIQSGYEKIVGNPNEVPVSGSPVVSTWSYKNPDINATINPGLISRIENDLTKLANPAPWQTSYAVK